MNGKPHFGIWLGSHIIINSTLLPTLENWQSDSLIGELTEKLRSSTRSFLYKGLEVRHESIIYRQPYKCDSSLVVNGTLGRKFLIWGRAFRVMRLLKKGVKRYKKVYRGGRRKLVRVG